MKALIIGASSEAGQSALAALREFEQEQQTSFEIITTTSRASDTAIEGASQTIGEVNLAEAGAAERILNAVSGPIDVMFYTPAFGPVGYPIARTNQNDVNQALDFSYHPLVRLSEELPTRRTIAYSSFYWLPHISVAYGAMGAAKFALEKLALDNPERYRIIRSGTFFSKSTRGISLMIKRALKSTDSGFLQPLVDRWQASGLGFQDYFFHYAHSVERETFEQRFTGQPHRHTTRDDLKEQALAVLRGSDAPIHNVIGDWRWTDNALPPIGTAEHRAIAACV